VLPLLKKSQRLLTLSREIDIIFKKIQEGLQDFDYHYERYESIQNTEDDSDNQREKEKLANDLKKEIKKLQKFREQIKHWLQNDTVHTLGPVGTSYESKLAENKSLIEDSMETYKLVEKQSKLKTFSNQSIMMTFMDSTNGDDDDDDDDSDDDELFSGSDEDEEDEYSDLPEDAVNAIHFFKDSILQLREQTHKLDHEYEKLAAKKLRKNNLATIEAKKEKIQLTIGNNKFHQKKLKKLLRQLTSGVVTEFNLIWLLKDDLNKYLESNGDYEFTRETELYDDIFNQIAAVEEDYSEIHEDNHDHSHSHLEKTSTANGTHHESATTTATAAKNSSVTTRTSPSPILTKANGHIKESSVESGSPTTSRLKLLKIHTNTLQLSTHSNTSSSTHAQAPRQSPELTSPAIVKTLRPATAPSKPVGTLKWSAAAAAAIPDVQEKPELVETESNGSSVHKTVSKDQYEERINYQSPAPTQQQQQPQTLVELKTLSTTQSLASSITDNINLDKYKEVIKNSNLTKTELGLFSDMNLARVPPGIQDLVISFASKRNNDNFKVLVDSTEFNQFALPLHKPYLPEIVQPSYYSQYTSTSFKHPTPLVKFQSYWNQVRANFGFQKLMDEIKSLTLQNNADNLPIIAELTFVLFYGFYYGVTPAENLIAESYLFELGWKPYKNQSEDGSNNLSTGAISLSDINGLKSKSNRSSNYYFWFKRVKLISRGEDMGQPSNIEFGDYQVFDLSFWEIFVKYGFKFDYNLCQMEPSKTLF